ncbi:17558_t:CDS:1, partial [Acaulospora colombiana]
PSSQSSTKNGIPTKIIILTVGLVIALIILVTIMKSCLDRYWNKSRKNVCSDKSLLVPQYQRPNNRGLKKSSVSKANSRLMIPQLAYLEGAHEKIYTQVLDDRMMEIDIQISNMAIVPKPKLHVVNPDKSEESIESV